MRLESVISKTGAGMRELRRAGSRIDRRQRGLLAAVDGRASIAQLGAMAGLTADEALALCLELEKAGFIRDVELNTAGEADLDFTQLSAARLGEPQ